MCGIFGVVRPGGVSQEDRAAFARLSLQLKHRGPDGFGQLEHHGVLAGMHRLSIIDIKHGWPPFQSGDGSVAALANGEIYNSPELARVLQAKGRELRSHSDLEVIPHLYEDLGSDYVSRLRGMFAICVLDTRQETVLLTRDRLGEKPLFYLERSPFFTVSLTEQSGLAARCPLSCEPRSCHWNLIRVCSHVIYVRVRT